MHEWRAREICLRSGRAAAPTRRRSLTGARGDCQRGQRGFYCMKAGTTGAEEMSISAPIWTGAKMNEEWRSAPGGTRLITR
jgi:hypothetical protein